MAAAAWNAAIPTPAITCVSYGNAVHFGDGHSHRAAQGLKALIESVDSKGVRADQVKRAQNILTALRYASSMDVVAGPPGWRIHQLTGDRAGTWSISVSGNWRITFDVDGGAIYNLDLEDYH